MKHVLAPVTAFFIFFILGCTSTSTSQSKTSDQQKPAVINIQQDEFLKLTKDPNTVVIDVRTPGEVAEGYISGTKYFIDFNGGNFANEIQKLDKSKSYIVYCRSGGRSSKAASIMIENGFNKVYNLTGGIMNWTGGLVK
ncbi:MAG: rhodanese-like domain-containing protein [Flavobacteriales bacterium]|nr:rhodanese-like domain-containing protein [Flavobacteriales bacterium]